MIWEDVHFTQKQTDVIFDETRHELLGGAIGSSKSCTALWKLGLHIQKCPNARVLIARKTYPALRDSVMKDFKDICKALWPNEGDIPVQRQSAPFDWVWKTGQEVYFRHLQDDEALENIKGMSLSAFLIDQANQIDQNAFFTITGRLRVKAKEQLGLMTANPNGHSWLWHDFVNPKTRKTNHSYHHFTLWDNAHNLPEATIEDWMSKPEWWKKINLFGSWDEWEGLVYHMFDESVHVIRNMRIPNSWEKIRSVDWGYAAPTVCLWIAKAPSGHLFVYREYYRPQESVGYHANQIIERTPVDEKINRNVIDYACFARTMNPPAGSGAPWSVIDYLETYGLSNWEKAQKQILPGIELVADYLSVREDVVNPITGKRGSPRVFIMESCVNTIDEFQQYKKGKVRIDAQGRVLADDRPVDDHNDAMDALRYGVMALHDPEYHWNDEDDEFGGLGKDEKFWRNDPEFVYGSDPSRSFMSA